MTRILKTTFFAGFLFLAEVEVDHMDNGLAGLLKIARDARVALTREWGEETPEDEEDCEEV